MTRRMIGPARTAGRLVLGVAVTALAASLAALAVPPALASPESDAADAINQAWDAAGGSDSPVGGKDGEVYQVGGGYGQKFTDGKIFFTPQTGAHLLYGAILDKYESLGGPGDSDLGFPTIDEVEGLVGPDSRVSTFSASDKPAIFWTPDTGAWAVRGAINVAWDKLGGSSGTLGVPIEDERYDGALVSQKFTGGELSWNTATNTFTTVPAELADNLIGLEVPVDATTQINQAWRASGGLGGPLGARQGDQSAIGDNGASQGYAGGKIFFTPDTGAHALTGAILSKYESLGGPASDLGLPIGTETEGGVPNSRVSAFSAPDEPVIFWTPDSGAIVVRGAINAAWQQLGAAGGTLGVPSGEQTVSGDTATQKFAGGQISWNRATKEFSTEPAELASELRGLDLPEAVAQAPAGTAPGGAAKTGLRWHWWWLAIIVPLLLILVGVLATRGRRRDGGFRADETDGGQESAWPGWPAPGAGGEFDTDEDAIDTAPTRIPTETELAGFGETGFAAPVSDVDSGRHSAGNVAGSSSMWHLDLGDFGEPRRHRRAADELPDEPADELPDELPDEQKSWTIFPAADFTERVGERFEAEIIVTDIGSDFTGGAGTAEATAEEEPWRPAIHLPLADPYQPPEGYFIKANTHSGLYYTPDSALYENTVPEVWFASEDVAQANGFVRAPE